MFAFNKSRNFISVVNVVCKEEATMWGHVKGPMSQMKVVVVHGMPSPR